MCFPSLCALRNCPWNLQRRGSGKNNTTIADSCAGNRDLRGKETLDFGLPLFPVLPRFFGSSSFAEFEDVLSIICKIFETVQHVESVLQHWRATFLMRNNPKEIARRLISRIAHQRQECRFQTTRHLANELTKKTSALLLEEHGRARGFEDGPILLCLFCFYNPNCVVELLNRHEVVRTVCFPRFCCKENLL